MRFQNKIFANLGIRGSLLALSTLVIGLGVARQWDPGAAATGKEKVELTMSSYHSNGNRVFLCLIVQQFQRDVRSGHRTEKTRCTESTYLGIYCPSSCTGLQRYVKICVRCATHSCRVGQHLFSCLTCAYQKLRSRKMTSIYEKRNFGKFDPVANEVSTYYLDDVPPQPPLH